MTSRAKRNNLIRLGQFILEFMPENQFTVGCYNENNESPRTCFNSNKFCNTVCLPCVAPFTPGLEPKFSEYYIDKKGEMILNYNDYFMDRFFDDKDAFEFIFSGHWSNLDSTKAGTVKRIVYLLHHDCDANSFLEKYQINTIVEQYSKLDANLIYQEIIEEEQGYETEMVGYWQQA